MSAPTAATSGRPSSTDSGDGTATRLNKLSAYVNESAQLPKAWLFSMIGVAILATLDVSRASGGSVTVAFKVGTTALIALALMWLPMLLRIFALAGGSVKAGGLEASMPGALS